MPRPRPLRYHLLRLALAGLIPMAVFAGGLLVLMWRHQKIELFRSLQDTARAVGLAVDREVETSIKRLEVIASQDTVLDERWSDLTRESQRLLATSEDWVNLLVFSADGEELVNVRAQPERPLPAFDAVHYIDRVVDENRPIVSDLFISPTSGEPVVHVAIPVVRDGRPVLVLAASLDLGGFDRLLADQAVRREGVAGIFDRDLRYIARSRDSGEHLGQRPLPDLAEHLGEQASGTGRFSISDSPEVYAAWVRSETSGWTVSFGVPAAPVVTSLRSSLVMLGEVGLIVVLVTVLIALHLGRRLAGSITTATDSAMALAKAEPQPRVASSIAELDLLGAALEQAGAMLARASRERECGEREREQLLVREQLARKEAEAAGRAKDEFLAMLGHELRNPLAPILFAVELAKTHADAPTRELEVIERQAKHIERLVADLLDVARIVQGKVSLDRRVEELHPIIAKAVEIAAPMLENKQHVLGLDVPRTGLLVDADETRLAQVVANLLTNAAKFTAAGGDILVSAAREADEVVIRVRDSGVGIAPEFLPHVFDIFTQGKRNDATSQGLGLGLALVRSFVRLHGGDVEAESSGLGCGSTFVVRLPVVEREPEQGDADERRVPDPPVVSARVLVVDDNVDAAETLATLLEVRGYRVRTAYDGRRALEVAAELAPEVAIVDLGMPVMDGYQVAEALAQVAPRPLLIAVTGYGQDHDRARSKAAGFDHHLVKPVAPDELLRYLERAVG